MVVRRREREAVLNELLASADALSEDRGPFYRRYLVVGIAREVEFVVDEVGPGGSARETEEACVGAGAERYDLFPSGWIL